MAHALSRAAAAGALEIGPASDHQSGDPLSSALQAYAVAQAKVGDARLVQDQAVEAGFLKPWQLSLQAIQAAMKSRQTVRQSRCVDSLAGCCKSHPGPSRLQLDSARMTLKGASGGPRVEEARLEVENAEEKLVTATEEAIGLMKRVLEDVCLSTLLSLALADRERAGQPEPIKAIAELAKAQQEYHTAAAASLQGVIGDVADAAAKAEADFR